MEKKLLDAQHKIEANSARDQQARQKARDATEEKNRQAAAINKKKLETQKRISANNIGTFAASIFRSRSL